ncbi:MAG: hypothetical protein LUH22_08805 [Bacteroides sp.]|nr:hypothetical protein [Bacteroides sp.]
MFNVLNHIHVLMQTDVKLSFHRWEVFAYITKKKGLFNE